MSDWREKHDFDVFGVFFFSFFFFWVDSVTQKIIILNGAYKKGKKKSKEGNGRGELC